MLKIKLFILSRLDREDSTLKDGFLEYIELKISIKTQEEYQTIKQTSTRKQISNNYKTYAFKFNFINNNMLGNLLDHCTLIEYASKR